jgi:hypothetical protein
MKKLLFLAIIFVSNTNFGQNIETVVESKIEFGNNFIYFLKNDLNNDIYKTSAFPNDNLEHGETIVLKPSINSADFEIYHSDILTNQLAQKISNDLNNGLISQLISLDLPIVDNNILFFRDTTHLYSFYEDFNEINNTDGEISFENFLIQFEELFSSHNSFRLYLDQKYGDTKTEEEFISFENEEFISDQIHQSLFNENRLLGIKDRVYYFHYLNEIVSVDKNFEEGIETLVNISQLSDFNIYDPQNEIIYNSDYLFEDNPIVRYSDRFELSEDSTTVNHNKAVFIVNNEVQFQSRFTQYYQVEDCNPYKVELALPVYKITTQPVYDQSGTQIGYNTSESFYSELANLGAVLTIDWGDGTTEVKNNFSGTSPLEHTYPGSGTYEVQTHIEWIDPVFGQTISLRDGSFSNQAASFHITYDLNGISCTSADDARWNHNESSDYRLRTKIWINQNVFGRHVGSYSQCYKYSLGSWSKKKADLLKTTIDADFRNDQCNFETNKDGEKERNNRREVSRTKTTLFQYNYSQANGDVKSSHRLEENGVVIITNLVLNPC